MFLFLEILLQFQLQSIFIYFDYFVQFVDQYKFCQFYNAAINVSLLYSQIHSSITRNFYIPIWKYKYKEMVNHFRVFACIICFNVRKLMYHSIRGLLLKFGVHVKNITYSKRSRYDVSTTLYKVVKMIIYDRF